MKKKMKSSKNKNKMKDSAKKLNNKYNQKK